MQDKIISVSGLAELPHAATEVLEYATNERILLFEGEMAAGKTTLIKEICRQAGVTEPVSSPTYGLVNEYESQSGETLYHFDFYRITDVSEALNMGVMDYFDSGNFCFVEWPSHIEAIWPEHFVQVTIEKGIGEARTLILKRF